MCAAYAARSEERETQSAAGAPFAKPKRWRRGNGRRCLRLASSDDGRAAN